MHLLFFADTYADLASQLNTFLGDLEVWASYAVFMSVMVTLAGVGLYWLSRAKGR